MVSDKVDFLAGNCMGAMPDTTPHRKRELLHHVSGCETWRSLNCLPNVTARGWPQLEPDG